MKIAIEGCAHGELEKIYDTIQSIEKAQNIKVDLLLCCGDFQSTRNLDDLQTMAVPKKYQDMCTFYKYYSGELLAPMLTIFIGGNHEASNYLQELPYGGWVAPNIYYLGYAGVVRVNGLRLAGISGIYKGHDYLRGRHEFTPYTEATRKSVYHVRQLEVFRLKQLSSSEERLDIFLSHDWPRGIYNYGNKAQLVRFKPHFRDEVDSDQLGSRPCEDLLKMLKPAMWFAAHLHCKFAAVVPHDDDEHNDVESTNADKAAGGQELFTKFLALDKCLPKRRFLQLLDIDTPPDHTGDSAELCFEYDLEWLAILQLTNHLTNVKSTPYYLPGPRSGIAEERHNFTPSAEELQQVRQRFDGNLRVPTNFCRTAEPYNPATDASRVGGHLPQPKAVINPQSTQFCDTLGIDDPLSLAMIIGGHELNQSSVLDVSVDTTASTLNDSSTSILLGDLSTVSVNSSGCGGGADAGNVSPPSSSTSLLLLQSSPLKRKTSSLGLCLPQPSAAPTTSDHSPLASPNAVSTSLNAEQLQLDESSAEETTDAEEALAQKSAAENSEIVSKPAAAVDEALNAEPQPIKKFKRRNQNIYKEEIDDAEIVL